MRALAKVKWRSVIGAAMVLALGVILGWLVRGPSIAAVAEEDPSALALTELTRFYEATSGRVPLADVLGEAFQVMRTDGTRYDRAEYLARPPSISGYKLSDIRAVQSGDLLTATFFAGVTGTIENVDVDAQDGPRLAVFGKEGGEWKVQAFAVLGARLPADTEAIARKAVEAWVGAVISGDREKVKAILAPEFQIVRADGSAYDNASYLQSELPKFTAMPEIKDLVVTGHGDYLVARYLLSLGPKLGSVQQQAYAPRLTVFRKRGNSWIVVAHGNFAAIER